MIAPVKSYTVKQASVRVYGTTTDMARAAASEAAKLMRDAISNKRHVRIIVATGNSQLGFIGFLTKEAGIDWRLAEVFHMDEYVGMPSSHPASFANWLKTRLSDVVHPGEVHYLNGDSADIEGEMSRYGGLLTSGTLDVCFLGIGENGHIAFNDPHAADFCDPMLIKRVTLDRRCRQQQVGEGHFESLEMVPKEALTLTCPSLISAVRLICCVPERRKAEAVRKALQGPLNEECPASLLVTHPGAQIYLDTDSAALLEGLIVSWEHSRSRALVGGNSRFIGPMKTAMHGNIPGIGYARLEIRGTDIASVQVLGPSRPNTMFISPGFIDIQVNGFSGIDFSSPRLTAEEVVKILPCLWRTGVTTFCPTLITNSHDKLLRSLRILEEARGLDLDFESAVPCYHLEGPYISPLGSRGVHDPDLIRLPDWDEFLILQMAAGGRIGIITIAPEVSGALQFIRKAKAAGVLVAIGHTDAMPEQIHAAVDAGATFSTHWGNGCPQYLHRHTNPLWAQLAIESLSLSLICDGFHLPPDVVKVAAQIKGTKRCVLITDAVHVANMAAGRYTLVTTEIELLPSGQVITVDGRCLAGSALAMNQAITIFMDFAQISLSAALEAATSNPAELIQRPGICSKIAKGQPANLVCYRFEQHGLEIETVIFKGKQVYSRDRREV